MNRKLRVVWICHFSNSKIRNLLPLKNEKYFDFAPWITNLYKEFEKRKDVELHIIAPHYGLQKRIYSFRLGANCFYFYNPQANLINRIFIKLFPNSLWIRYGRNRRIVRKQINKIVPDVINLHGAENDYYSYTVLGIKKIPVIVTIQGIYSDPKRFVNGDIPLINKIMIERKIHKQIKYFGIFSPHFVDLIKRDNQNPIFLRQTYISSTNVVVEGKVEKTSDFVFFGRVTHVKGIEDILEAIAIIKKVKTNVSLLIIGHCEENYKSYLLDKCTLLEIKENVVFAGYMSEIEEVHLMAMSAKISVIASKFENLPGTIIESFLLGLPVISTNVGGIPFLNKDGEVILLSDPGDVITLASNMLKFLNNPKIAEEMCIKGIEFIKNELAGERISNNFVIQYINVIEHFKNNTPISKTILY